MERSYKPMKSLKLKRVEKGLTQGELAKMVGISQNSLSLYELGSHFPRRKVLDRLADVLECSVVDLL